MDFVKQWRAKRQPSKHSTDSILYAWCILSKDLLSQRKVSNQTRAFCLFPMIQWQLTTEYSATWTISCGAPYAMHDTQKIITFMNYSIWLHTKRQIITCKRCPKQDGTFFIICRCTVDFVFRTYLVFTAKIHLQISRICVARLSICQYLPPFASHIGRKLMCCLSQKHIWRTMLSNSRNLDLWIPRTWQYSRTFLSIKPLFSVRKCGCNKEAISACVLPAHTRDWMSSSATKFISKWRLNLYIGNELYILVFLATRSLFP